MYRLVQPRRVVLLGLSIVLLATMLALPSLTLAGPGVQETRQQRGPAVGTIRAVEFTTCQQGATHFLYNEQGMAIYQLVSGRPGVDLSQYEGQRVRVVGRVSRERVEGCPPLLYVTKVLPAR